MFLFYFFMCVLILFFLLLNGFKYIGIWIENVSMFFRYNKIVLFKLGFMESYIRKKKYIVIFLRKWIN